MGLCINWTLVAPEGSSADTVKARLLGLREACMDLPFEGISELVHFDKTEISHRLQAEKDDFRWLLVQSCASIKLSDDGFDVNMASVEPLEVIGFAAFPGEASESMNCFLARYPEKIMQGGQQLSTGLAGWRGSAFAKTQYASMVTVQHFLRCHLSIVAALDCAKQLGLLETVYDEGAFWEERSPEKLLKNVQRWNEMTAAFVGGLETATGQSFVAPIKLYWDYERLEHFGTNADTAAFVKAIAKAMNRELPE